MSPKFILSCLAALIALHSSVGLRPDVAMQFPLRKEPDPCAGGQCGEPLYLSPFIQAGNITEARRLSRVGSITGFEAFPSYSGFICSNKTTNNQLFFWYFPVQSEKPTTDPLILWLQGGPGASSLFGLFSLNGPITVLPDMKVIPKPFSWNNKYQMLYIDQPAGTGFSFYGNNKSGIVNTEERVASEMLEFLRQFFILFPELNPSPSVSVSASASASVPFYIAGESYGGHYAPAIAHAIHLFNKKSPSSLQLPLTGIILGDPWSDAESQIPHDADYLYNTGMVSEKQREIIKQYMIQAEKYRAAGDFPKAFGFWNEIWADYSLPHSSYFTNCTGSTYTENIAQTEFNMDAVAFRFLFAKASFRKAIHVGALQYGGRDVYGTFVQSGDFFASIKPLMSVLLENYRVLVYNGNLDALCNAPGVDAFVASIVWSGQTELLNSNRKIWKVSTEDAEVAGFVRQARNGNVARAIVRNAGHMTPLDAPRACQDMIIRFISAKF
eukprot:TRINITY_DN343_c0_g2_i1.p1 TRINITY_DN343_c0_g2~~TRINITY_DN343_c0_g2_i1.p1  ORF type:complete len:497 (+),score=111.72 TRINITY_DN343_c0_g2_i1:59-1549(+)